MSFKVLPIGDSIWHLLVPGAIIIVPSYPPSGDRGEPFIFTVGGGDGWLERGFRLRSAQGRQTFEQHVEGGAAVELLIEVRDGDSRCEVDRGVVGESAERLPALVANHGSGPALLCLLLERLHMTADELRNEMATGKQT